MLIVGAGPTGLTAAAELARGGLIPTVIEKRTEPSVLSRAVGIIPATMDLLTPMGAADPIRAEAISIRAAIVHSGAKQVARIALDRDPDLRVFGLPQDRTEAHLSDALTRHGGAVRYGAPLESLTLAGGVATATIQGEVHEFDHVVGADGTRSLVRKAVGQSYDGVDVPGIWSIADVEIEDIPNIDCLNLYLLPKGRLSMVIPLEANRVRIVSNTPNALEILPVKLPIVSLRREGRFDISVRQVSAYRTGPVLLAGDAAHCHSPVGGRGMNLGIADAADLAARLLGETLDGYASERHRIGAAIMAQTEAMRKIMTAANPLTRSAALLALRAINLIPALNRRVARQVLT